MATLRSMPGGGQLWLVTDAAGNGLAYQVAYLIPGTDRWMAWTISDPDELMAITGSSSPVADRSIVHEDLYRQGVLQFGITRELVNTDQHPFDSFTASFEKEAEIRPWLRDPEILALTAGALLEGRTPTQAELATTNWFKQRNDKQREWASLVASDPATAAKVQQDNKLRVDALLQQAGIYGVGEAGVSYMAQRWTTGDWSEVYLQDQVRRLQNPNLGPVDESLMASLSGVAVKRQSEYADDVRDIVGRWLGPVHGRWDEAQVQSWAGRLATEPAAQDVLIEELKRQRLAVMPEYDNPNLDYESIAQPWRGVVSTAWGQTADETDPLFERILRMNDRGAAETLLRQSGLERGVTKVRQDAMASIGEAFGAGQARKAI